MPGSWRRASNLAWSQYTGNMENQEAVLMSKITFRLPADLHRRFKIVQIEDGRSMEHMLVKMVEQWVEAQEAKNE